MSTGWECAEVLEILLSSGIRKWMTWGGSVGDSPHPDWAWSFVYVYLIHPNRLISTSKTKIRPLISNCTSLPTPASTQLCPLWTLSIMACEVRVGLHPRARGSLYFHNDSKCWVWAKKPLSNCLGKVFTSHSVWHREVSTRFEVPRKEVCF